MKKNIEYNDSRAPISDDTDNIEFLNESAKDKEILSRLDYLPFTKKHRKLLFGSGIGWAFDAMDVGLITYIIAVLATQWNLTDSEKSWIVSAGFIGMAIGASLGGTLADKIGRKNVFTITLVIYGIATGASALASGVVPLIILRIIVGLGLGGELPIASTLVSELSPKKVRGSIVVWLEAFWAFGWIFAALIGFYIVPANENGWRIAFAIGAIPALYAVIVRLHLPESVRYLLKTGQKQSAEDIVSSFEESAGISKEENLQVLNRKRHNLEEKKSTFSIPVATSSTRDETQSDKEKSTIARLFAPQFRQRTSAIWTVWFMVNFAYYGAFIWIPSILHASGHSLVKSFGFTLIITLAQIPGYACAAYLIEKWGRRPTLITFLIGSAASAVMFGISNSDLTIILSGCLLSFFNLGSWGALYAITPEIYPTAIRATGAGSAAGFGRLASIVAPFAVTALLSIGAVEGGNKILLFVVFSAAFLIAAVATLILPEFKGKSLSS